MSSPNNLAQYYRVLGVSPTASTQEIKRAYRNLAKVWHPDRFINDPTQKARAEQEFKKINEAYTAIKQAEKQVFNSNAVATASTAKNTPEYHYQAGKACAEIEDYQGAIAQFSLAIKLDPNYLEAYQYRGFILSKLGLENRASADLQTAERLKLIRKVNQTTRSSRSPQNYSQSKNKCSLKRTIMAHKRAVNCVVISPDGRFFASGGKDKKIKLWELNTGQAIANLIGHSGSVNCLIFNEVRGNSVVSRQGTIHRHQKSLISASQDKTIRFWDLAQRKLIRTLGGWFEGHTKGINSLVINPNSNSLISGSDDNSLKIWDLTTGEERETISSSLSTVTCMAISHDGRVFCSGGLERQLRIRNARTGKVITSIRGDSGVLSLAFSPDDNLLATGGFDRQIKIWDIVTRQEIYTLAGHSDRVSSLAFSPDGKILISASWDKTIKLWRLNTGKELATITGHNDQVLSLAIALDGKTLVSSSADGVIKIWQCNF